MSDLSSRDISHELWREYEWVSEGVVRVYRIESPVSLFTRPGGTTHRVVDADGVAHCIPAVGYMGCALRWKNPKDTEPVRF